MHFKVIAQEQSDNIDRIDNCITKPERQIQTTASETRVHGHLMRRLDRQIFIASEGVDGEQSLTQVSSEQKELHKEQKEYHED